VKSGWLIYGLEKIYATSYFNFKEFWLVTILNK
jgi:hypothetical protein